MKAAVATVTMSLAMCRVYQVVEIGWPVLAKGNTPAPIKSKTRAPSAAPMKPPTRAPRISFQSPSPGPATAALC